MTFNANLKNIFLVVFTTLILSACSTAKKSGNMDGDVYTGKETVKYLASGVPDRVFFATNKSSLTTAARSTLRKQATFLRKNKRAVLGMCVGLECAVIEVARNVCGISDANSTEFSQTTKNPVIDLLPNQNLEDDDIGASEDYKESDDNDKEMTIKKPMMTILSPKAPGRLPSYPLFMLPNWVPIKLVPF